MKKNNNKLQQTLANRTGTAKGEMNKFPFLLEEEQDLIYHPSTGQKPSSKRMIYYTINKKTQTL